MSAVARRLPTTRVISPSPTPSERLQDDQAHSQDSYIGPTTRSAARKRLSTPQPVEEDIDEDEYESNPDVRRSRTRSRSPIKSRRIAPLSSTNGAKATKVSKTKATTLAPTPQNAVSEKKSNGSATNGAPSLPAIKTNGHLAPPSTAPPSSTSYWSWRDFSRSPSPLGLIPIHRHWRTFVHKYEVPRKILHVSIGFVVVWLYLRGTQTDAVWPWLLAALVPISVVDLLRHHHPGFNRVYVSVLGALMRESEFSGYNGVIFYLLGALIVLYCFPKDVGVVGTLLLSWCDTAASTFGRLYGAYTPRIRRGKSLAGSSAAFLVGVATAASFWGWLVPTYGPLPGDEAFMFRGSLSLPSAVAEPLGLSASQATASGPVALGVVSLWSGFVAAASEVVDVFGWDDNLTIPVLSGFFIWGFLKIFG
ncbi:phosphatidate cytidylyltransferase [Magnaporthiopsis poae ATCC 64411]|uniref:Phosphatidate cytidylyltransferase n=1 Tax=Magnaporthiopsis poae (strain ATCC 64411 / 73-15) TaxID=644358 RepID=A0A0C4EBF7_MAGP6|nr:phosphatidate cytidylyltransferase [Magnaporthiopsis poae ATCC 64411]